MTHEPTLEDVIREIPRCPKCGQDSYVVEPIPERHNNKVESVVCQKCKEDILDAYWTLTGRL